MTKKTGKPAAGQQWNAEHYDKQIGFVSELGKGLIALLKAQAGERILDLGCGTGDLAYEIAQMGAHCVGIDYSQEMIDKARSKYPGVRFEQADGQAFRLKDGEQPYDAVFSNAALHWMKRPEQVAESVWLALRPGGRFVAEFGGAGNVETIFCAVRDTVKTYGIDAGERDPWYFPTIGEYASILENQGFQVGYAELYDRPTRLSDGEQGMRHWLKAFAGVFFEGLTEKEKEEAADRCVQLVKPVLYEGGQWMADYRRIRVHAMRPWR
ncbi:MULTISPECIES: class I SAM-dependent methyltransferase [Paenibacillus]|uniref:Methyltransferase domain-containing protein n=1 Tax=Paenibacillus validus TaxID=44253 RepID=A0A7X2Z9K9_9BACL|nr:MULTISPECIES: class I SAM-dependent methyltransferase [Paenibacillus]MUG70791.1 methyltransferase domain-containing protein [Paenibacillus validus]